MRSILLYTDAVNSSTIVLMWSLIGVFFVLLLWFLYRQWKMGKRLKEELDELDKVKQNNIEYDFVLKAMKIAVWRYDS
ncbi:MAG: hypothetical protein IJ569_00225, partial [Prevotella sp.]|nr:hypothetical protein [Prevotella sp.]